MLSSSARSVEIVARDGFPLAAQLGGPSGAPAILLLPGQANSHRWWNGLRSAFESDFMTVTFDYRGTGGSRVTGRSSEPNRSSLEERASREAWSTASFADDAADVLQALGLRSAAVYGTSMGGRVAQMLSTQHPELVEALVLACTSPGGPQAVAPDEDARAQFSGVGATSPEHRLRMLHAMFYTPSWPHGPSESPLLGDPTMSPGERGAHRRVSRGHAAWQDLPAVVAPTLVLHGSDDRVTPPENSARIAARIPRARSIVYPEGRHGFFDEFAETVNRDILNFLSR